MPASLKLLLGASIVIVVTGYMAYVGASSSWKYYLTADECLADPAEFVGQRLRVSGRVAAGSLHINGPRTEARFALEGQQGRLQVICQGILPDNLAEGTEVVVEGRLAEDGLLQGDEVLTRCASKYDAEAATAEGGNAPRPANEEAL